MTRVAFAVVRRLFGYEREGELARRTLRGLTPPRAPRLPPALAPPWSQTCYFLVAFAGPGCLAMTRSLILS